MGLTLRLLGPPSIEVDGAPLAVDTRKAVALLVLLAVRGDLLTRAVAADMLWPDAPPDRARASLRRTLSALTSGLGGRWVKADRSAIWLTPADDVDCDLRAFRDAVAGLQAHGATHGRAGEDCAVCLATARAAAGRYGGAFLDGFVLRDAPSFDDWVVTEAENLRRDACGVLERVVRGQEAGGDHEEALASARAWLAMDPLHEQAHRAVMRLAARAGRRDEAIRQYRQCVAVLDDELGVAPLPETTALYTAILDDTAPASMAPVPTPAARPMPPPTPAADTPPLVGRDEELALLQRVHAELARGAAGIVVEGEAGIGKTRVAAEFVEYAAGRGAIAVHVRCREGEAGLTCGPLVDLLRRALAHDASWLLALPAPSRAEVARIVPEVADLPGTSAPPTPLDSPGAQARFLDGLFDAIVGIVAGPLPGVVFVDDLHWADPTTVDVLTRGLHRHDGTPILLLTTWRSELVAHDDPLRRAWRGTRSRGVVVPRLTRDEVTELVDEVRPSMADLADRLHEETEGIPFFVIEYLTALDEGAWELPGPVRDLLTARLQPLTELGRQCLTAAAVLGRSFDLSMLVRTSGRSEDEVVTALEELLARRLVVEHGGSGEVQYDFTHTKLREVSYATASLARRRLLHRRAAEAIAAQTAGAPAAASRVAHHFALAGRESDAAAQYVVAGQHARSLFANREALAHFETALALRPPDVVAVHLHIGDLHALSGRYDDAAASYGSAAAHADDDARLAGLEHRLGRLAMRRGAWSWAAVHLDRALDLLGEDADAAGDAALVRADRAATALRLGEEEAAGQEADRAVAEAEAGGDPAAIATARNTAGLVARRRGRPDEAHRHLRIALAAAERLHDPAARVAALNNLALSRPAGSDVEDSLALTRQALALCDELGDVHRAAALHSNLADLLHEAGRTDEAMPHLKESARLLAEVDEPTRPEPEIWKLTDW